MGTLTAHVLDRVSTLEARIMHIETAVSWIFSAASSF